MASPPVMTGMSLEDYQRTYDEIGAFELIDGEIIPVPPNHFGHTSIANKLAFWINQYAMGRELGEAHVEGTFTLLPPGDPNWVKGSRIADVIFIRQARLVAYKQSTPDWNTRPLPLIPDLAVEILSTNDTFAETHRKAERYFADGVSQVWIIDPPKRSLFIPVPGTRQYSLLTHEDTLEGGDLIPGFTLPLQQVFA